MRVFYNLTFILLVWTPFVWRYVKPVSGTIDHKAHWFHKYAVRILNEARAQSDSQVLFSFMGLMVRDPHSKPDKAIFKYSESHLFVLRRQKRNKDK